MINKKLFTNAELNGSYQLVYTHNLNTQDVIPTLYDSVGLQTITADNFALGDETGNNKDNIVTLSLNNPITGTWKLLLSYQSGSETTSGRRAFEFGTGTPSDDSRLVYGKAATPSLNITFASLYSLLLTKLGFLKLSENLNDLPDKSQARTNLGVYETVAVDNALAQKATLYQAASGAVLGVANTAVFKPSGNYHPATKLYTEDMAGKTLYDATDTYIARGITNLFDVGTGNARYRITLPHAMGTSNYIPIVKGLGNKSSNPWEDNIVVTPIMNTRSTTYFDVIVYAIQDSAVQSVSLYYELKAVPTDINVTIAAL